VNFEEWKTRYHEVKMPEDTKLKVMDEISQTNVRSGTVDHRKVKSLSKIATSLGAAVAVIALSAGLLYQVRHTVFTDGTQHNIKTLHTTPAATVVVYPPTIELLDGPPPMTPTITTNVNSPTGRVTKLTVNVTLHGNAKAVTFQPVTLHVDSAPGNGASYHRSYTVTSQGVHLDANHSSVQYHTVISVPPESGSYTVFADSPTYNPSNRRELINLLYVNHGGFYRTSTITTNLHQQVGDVGVTVTRVEMTPARTRIFFYLTGMGAQVQSQPWGNQDTTVQQVLEAGSGNPTTVNSMTLGWSFGPIPKAQRQCEWDVDPTRTDTQQLKFNLNLLIPRSSAAKPDQYKFSFTLPVTNGH
jgi:hypothetical protein